MSEDRSSNGQKSWLGKLTQAFAHEPKNRQELLELLRDACLLYTSPSPRDRQKSRMPSSA